MNDRDEQITKAIAAADQQRTLAWQTFSHLVEEARTKLANGEDPTTVWAVLGMRMAKEMGCTSKHQQFVVEMLVDAAVRAAQTPVLNGDINATAYGAHPGACERRLPLHRTEATIPWGPCSTCEGGGCPDCTDLDIH